VKYTVIISTYCNKTEQFDNLLATVKSVWENSPKDIQLIVVNDGSKLPIGHQNADILVRHVKNKGIPYAWNSGLRLARGEYIAIINDDITVEKGWLDKLRVALEDDPDNWVAAPGVKGQENGVGIVQDHQWFPGYCFMMPANIRELVGYFDEQFAPFDFEDTDYWTRVLSAGKQLVRNYSTTITHVGGHVLHTLDYDKVNETNNAKFQKKWGFDPIPVFYENQLYDFTKLKDHSYHA